LTAEDGAKDEVSLWHLALFAALVASFLVSIRSSLDSSKLLLSNILEHLLNLSNSHIRVKLGVFETLVVQSYMICRNKSV
jgi:hypothetical protein